MWQRRTEMLFERFVASGLSWSPQRRRYTRGLSTCPPFQPARRSRPAQQIHVGGAEQPAAPAGAVARRSASPVDRGHPAQAGRPRSRPGALAAAARGLHPRLSSRRPRAARWWTSRRRWSACAPRANAQVRYDIGLLLGRCHASRLQAPFVERSALGRSTAWPRRCAPTGSWRSLPTGRASARCSPPTCTTAPAVAPRRGPAGAVRRPASRRPLGRGGGPVGEARLRRRDPARGLRAGDAPERLSLGASGG